MNPGHDTRENFLLTDIVDTRKDSPGLRDSATSHDSGSSTAIEIDYRALYEKARADGEFYSSLLNASSDPIVVYDNEGLVKYINTGFTKLFGWSIQDCDPIGWAPVKRNCRKILPGLRALRR